MQNFECDYLEGAHPLIMERLAATNMEKLRVIRKTVTVRKRAARYAKPADVPTPKFIFSRRNPNKRHGDRCFAPALRGGGCHRNRTHQPA